MEKQTKSHRQDFAKSERYAGRQYIHRVSTDGTTDREKDRYTHKWTHTETDKKRHTHK